MSRSAPKPATTNKSADLSNEEIGELDDLLAAVPEPWETLDVVMLDGYLCGVLVQPALLEPEQWLPPIFGRLESGESFGPDTPGWHHAKHERLLALLQRRKDALQRAILEEGWFDPIVPLPENEEGSEPEGKVAFEGLSFWVAGFEWALANFTGLEERGLEGVPDLLDSIWRHLPEQDETRRAMTQALDKEHPLPNLDAAIEALVFDIVDLHQIATAERLKVATVKREMPKVGRNDPCPCGSGRKYKLCHGMT